MAATENPGTEIGSLIGEKHKPNILLVIVGILIFLLVVAVGGFIGFTQLPKMAGNGVVEKKVVRLESKDVIALEPFLVNLADEGDIRFLKAEFRLGMTDKLKEGEPTSKDTAQIRDSIIRLLGSKTSDEISTTKGKDDLCEEIRILINERISQNRVAEVFIIDFLIQF